MQHRPDRRSLARTLRRQRLAIAGLGGLLVLLVGAGQAGQDSQDAHADAAPAYPRYAAGGDKLYRINEDGTIDYIVVDFAQGTADGIPGWARIHVDPTLGRDRMGNITRLPRR